MDYGQRSVPEGENRVSILKSAKKGVKVISRFHFQSKLRHFCCSFRVNDVNKIKSFFCFGLNNQPWPTFIY